MDFGRIFALLGDENIDKKEIFKLVDIIKSMDLEDEENVRNVIKQVSVIANKKIDVNTENAIVNKIKQEGLTTGLLDFL